MKDRLQEQRQYFDEKLAKLSSLAEHVFKFELAQYPIKSPISVYQLEYDLVVAETRAELAYRSGFLRGKIVGLGLEKFMADIMDGMNKTGSRVCSWDDNSETSAKQYQEGMRVDADALLRFGLDYIDRWVMYNKLFKKKK